MVNCAPKWQLFLVCMNVSCSQLGKTSFLICLPCECAYSQLLLFGACTFVAGGWRLPPLHVWVSDFGNLCSG